MPVRLGHPKPRDGVAFEIEFNQHDRFLADHPAIMPGIDRNDLRSLVLDDAAIRVFDVDLAPREKADVRVHAEVRPDGRFHVHRPAEPWRVNHPLDARGAGASHFQPYVPDLAAFRAADRCEECVRAC